MAFATGYLADNNKTGAGEIYGSNSVVLARESFEDDLKVGRFAKLDSGRIDNLDGSATPVIAGVVMRNVANVLEDGETIDSAVFEQINLVSQGLVTVKVKAGETPSFLGKVYASNAGDASDGLAITGSSGVDTNAVFIEEVDTNVWLINANPAPGDFIGTQVLADPGDAEAIAPTRTSTSVAITTADAETRTLSDPTFVGQVLNVSLDVDGGDAVITADTAVNTAGNNTMTMADAGDLISFVSVAVAGVPVWRITANDGVALSTV